VVEPGVVATRDPRRSSGPAWTVATAFAAAIAVACALERGEGAALFVLFGLPSLVFGLVSGRWVIACVPVALTTVTYAVGLECSPSETPQALMLAGAVTGVLCRRIADRVTGARR